MHTNLSSNNNLILENYVKFQLPKLKTITQADLNSMFEGFQTKNLVKNSKISETELIDHCGICGGQNECFEYPDEFIDSWILVEQNQYSDLYLMLKGGRWFA